MPVYHEPEPLSAGESGPLGESGGSWYTWWKGDPLPILPALPAFLAEPLTDPERIAALGGLSLAEALRHLQSGNRMYLARLGAAPVGHGWCATGAASIGELSRSFALPAGNLYLWGFRTEPAWRGRGIYGRLLRATLACELAGAQRFWIGHEPHNIASARGILKAGFQKVGDLYFLADGGLCLVAEGPVERAWPAAAILGVPLLRR